MGKLKQSTEGGRGKEFGTEDDEADEGGEGGQRRGILEGEVRMFLLCELQEGGSLETDQAS